MLQPVLVRPSTDGYELVAGERRWRAAQQAGLTEIPALIRETDDQAALAQAVVENVQRADLNAIEEAAAYQQLITRVRARPRTGWPSGWPGAARRWPTRCACSS